MKLKYKCLVLDHDDTTVNSTPEVHFPALLDTLSHLRPDTRVDFVEFCDYCFEPGFFKYCTEILGFNKEEMAYEYNNWKKYVGAIIPRFCTGMDKLIRRHKESGGIVCVATHSESDIIRRDWLSGIGIEPDAVYGWDAGEGKRKPDPFPVLDVMEKFSLAPSDILVIDDLKTGLDMARNASVAFACAGWGQPSERIRLFMMEHSDHYFSTPGELERYLFDE
jgi:phosphoglycolate phosphatase/pyrophosphatase PpaX